MKIKTILRKDRNGIVRLFRFIWTRGVVGDGRGYSAHLSIALYPRVFQWLNDGLHRRELTILGLRVSWNRAYGGHFA